MTSSIDPRRGVRLGSRLASFTGAAWIAALGCGTGGTGTPPGTENVAGAVSSSGGSSGTSASGGSGGILQSAAGTPGSSGASPVGVAGSAGAAAGGAAAGGSSGANGAAGAASLILANGGGKYSLSFGATYIEIDPSNGARITG